MLTIHNFGGVSTRAAQGSLWKPSRGGTILYLDCGDGYMNTCDKTAKNYTQTHTQISTCKTTRI